MRLPRRALWLGLPVLVALVAWGWWSGNLAVKQARRELAELEARQTELERQNRELVRQIEALRRERETRARAARESMDVAAPGETVVIVPGTPSPGGS